MGVVTELFLPLALAFIMFALGLGLTFDDFARVATRPGDFLVGALCQLVLLPIVAFVLIGLWPMAPELALGVMIIAAVPGGVTSNMITALARGDVALSISLTAVISLVSVITIPLIVAFAHGYIFGDESGREISVISTAIGVFLIVTVPVVLGLLTRQFAGGFAGKFEPIARRIASILFIIVLGGAILQERANIVPYFAQAGLVTLVLNVVMMVLAYLVAHILASGLRQKIAISIECGLQNGTLAIAVATLLFGGGPSVIPAATYSLIMFATSLILVAFWRNQVSDPALPA
ncbi:MAG: bile acid:sodium symporter family protein [Pseudomonadota bacterium]